MTYRELLIMAYGALLVLCKDENVRLLVEQIEVKLFEEKDGDK